jgi:hypothetical protein
MRKPVTGAIIIKVPGDKGREKALQLATHMSKELDPTLVKVAASTRTAELKIVGIDISIEKEELRQALALAAECGVAKIQVGDIGASRSGLRAAYLKCPVAGVRKLAQAGKVALGWSTARVIAIPKSPLQCYKCLELGHNEGTCVIGAAEADTVQENVPPPHLDAPCANRSGHPPTIGWEGRHVRR